VVRALQAVRGAGEIAADYADKGRLAKIDIDRTS
jgi:hypothetical protein